MLRSPIGNDHPQSSIYCDPPCSAPAPEPAPAPRCGIASCGCVDSITLIEPERIGLDSLVATVKYEAQGAPANVVAEYLRQAIIDHARHLGGLPRRWFFELQECVTDYYLAPAEGECIERVRLAWVDGKPVANGGRDQVIGSTNVICGCGELVEFMYTAPDQFVLREHRMIQRCPARSLEIVGTVVPCEDACVFDAEFLRKYARAIQHLALSRLFVIPDRKWTNFGLASRHEKLYLSHTREGVERDLVNSGAAMPRSALEGMRL